MFKALSPTSAKKPFIPNSFKLKIKNFDWKLIKNSETIIVMDIIALFEIKSRYY